MINRLIKGLLCVFDYVSSQDVDNVPLGNKRKQCKRIGFNYFGEIVVMPKTTKDNHERRILLSKIN